MIREIEALAGCVVGVEIGEGADGNRLEGRARAIGADFGDRLVQHGSNDRRDHGPADPALTGPHPATGEGLQLVRTGSAELRIRPSTNRYGLATADHDLVLDRDQHRQRRR